MIENVTVFLYMLLMARLVVISSLAVYQEFYPVNFHSVQDSERVVKTTQEYHKNGRT